MIIAGRTALVTGATGGIGQAIARRLHRAGAEIVLGGRRTEVLEPLARELGGATRVLAADLGEHSEVDRVARECAQADILVANAALPASGPLLDFTPEQIDRALEVNLRAPVMLARLMAEQMAQRGAGHLVFVSSLMGKTATPGSSIYAATKFGLRGFGRGLRSDLAPLGIGVSVVFPGFIRDAGMFHESGASLPPYVGTSTADEVAEHVRAAIEHDKGEVDVAPIPVRAGVKLAELAPGIAGKVTERLGSRQIAERLAAGQSSKR